MELLPIVTAVAVAALVILQLGRNDRRNRALGIGPRSPSRPDRDLDRVRADALALLGRRAPAQGVRHSRAQDWQRTA